MSNPVLNENFASKAILLEGKPMTIAGTVNKVFVLFAFLLVGAVYNWAKIANGFYGEAVMLMEIGGIVGFILVLVTIFNVKIAKYTAPIYALCEGLVLGGISALFEAFYQGIVFQTILGTFASLFTMLLLYKAKLIRYTDKFASVLKTAVLSVTIIYIIQIVASFFGRGIPAIFESGPIGIVFSLIVVAIASFCLIEDFYYIEESENRMMSKDYEWYGAFGLMITLVWLYMEILRLLSKLRSR